MSSVQQEGSHGPVAALHHAARRYCIDRRAGLGATLLPSALRRADKAARRWGLDHPFSRAPRDVWYGQIYGADVATARNALAHGAGPPSLPPKRWGALEARSQILLAILDEIELARPEDFVSFDAARDYLLGAGKAARVVDRCAQGRQILYEQDPGWEAHQVRAAETERRAYLAYVARLTPEEAARVPAPPFRHAITERDRADILALLKPHWGVDPDHHYWYPLRAEPIPSDVLATWNVFFHAEAGAGTVREILRAGGVGRLWELHESALTPDLEMDTDLADFFEIGGEAYWSSPRLDWLIYQSHEETLTFAGEWLVTALKQAWPTWEQRRFTGWPRP